MRSIRIRESKQGESEGEFSAMIRFQDESGREEEYSIQIRNPFDSKQEANLDWYFEEHLKYPFMHDFRFKQIGESIEDYGEQLFKQIFENPKVYSRYQSWKEGKQDWQIEIVGSPEFHALHWESLKDPDLTTAWSLRVKMLRKNLHPQEIAAEVNPSPVLQILLVVARPFGKRDVAYRTIAHPLIKALNQAKSRVKIHILRPATYKSLSKHLEEKRAGFYHAIHFDVHGGLLSYEEWQQEVEESPLLYQARYGRQDLEAYQELKAFLFLDGDFKNNSVDATKKRKIVKKKMENVVDRVEAQELSDLLQQFHIPVVILNACQSAKQKGSEETSLGSHLIRGGAQLVLAMSYSVTVSAASLMMETLYQNVFKNQSLAESIRLSRLELHNQPNRKAHSKQSIKLKDWILPVVYQNCEVEWKLRGFEGEELK